MNLQLLPRPTAAWTPSLGRPPPLVTVEPQVERREGGSVLVIPPDAGYGAVAEPMPSR